MAKKKEINCIFNEQCKVENEPECRSGCYAYSKSVSVWKHMNTPRRYSQLFLKDLPIERENPKPYQLIHKYVKDFDKYILDNGLGMFFYSISNDENVLGVGTGKTTSAIIIGNEYARHRIKQHLKKINPIEEIPTYFIELSDFQNKYNEQFRGDRTIQDKASFDYYGFKDLMKSVELLILDDLGTRVGLTDAFLNELYEILNHRCTEGLPVVYTSNIPIDNLTDVLGHRIVSRIKGSTVRVGFKGRDHRVRRLK